MDLKFTDRPGERMIEPQEIATLMAYLASSPSAATNGAAVWI